jgi:hypothetical protein
MSRLSSPMFQIEMYLRLTVPPQISMPSSTLFMISTW